MRADTLLELIGQPGIDHNAKTVSMTVSTGNPESFRVGSKIVREGTAFMLVKADVMRNTQLPTKYLVTCELRNMGPATSVDVMGESCGPTTGK